jgi:hypothetical protein
LAGDDRRGLADARRLLADTFPARLLPSHRSTAVEVAIRMVEERFLAQVSPPSP